MYLQQQPDALSSFLAPSGVGYSSQGRPGYSWKHPQTGDGRASVGMMNSQNQSNSLSIHKHGVQRGSGANNGQPPSTSLDEVSVHGSKLGTWVPSRPGAKTNLQDALPIPMEHSH